MAINKIVAQFKRELWENRISFLWAPVIFAILLFGASCWLMLNHDIAANIELARQGENAVPLLSSIYQVVSCALFLLVFAVVIAVYAHGTLFSDRKSREILFWRSMPVSEATNVLVKLAMVCVVVPLIIFVVTLAGAILFALLLGAMNSDFEKLWDALKALSLSVDLLGRCFIVALLVSPIIVWNLFCSALARRSPVIISVAVPLAVWVVDASAQKYLAINLFFKDALAAYLHLIKATIKRINVDSGTSVADMDLFTNVDPRVTSVALLISVLLIIATIWLRNNRYEI
ncbi:MAG: hypothetical protein B0W54_12070 [Cellvibrio sp. 79]|nr:MAG: hypothetical protein B0W54_12070 [Cellvibrio sp. 79]